MSNFTSTLRMAQAIYQDTPETSEVGAVTRRTREKEENRLYGDWWGARATGSCSSVDELTWFIRYVRCLTVHSSLQGYQTRLPT